MNWLLAHFEVVFVTLLALVTAVIILQQRRTPQSTAAWLLFIIVVPYVAIPLFLALGFRKRGKRFKPIALKDAASVSPTASPCGMATVFQHYGVPQSTDGNLFRLLATREDAYSGLIDLCRSADTDIEVMFYIVADDPIGQAFVNELTARARAGVRVRLLMDRLGNLRPPRAALSALRAAGAEVRFFSPLLQFPDRGHLNLRNHRKLVIADGNRVFAGGMNVGAEYMGQNDSATGWTDLSYFVEGPAIGTFRDIFRSDWGAANGTFPQIEPPMQRAQAGTATLQLVPSGPDTMGDPLHDVLVNAIHAASNRVWLVTPYFLPTEILGNALAIAARRGIDVRILLPQKSNQTLADFARGAYLRDMQDAGCTILFFQPGMIHAKVGIIDAAAYVGSANFDVRSMLLNFETALFAYDPGSVGLLSDWFLAQELFCKAGVPPAGHLRRISEGLFRLGAPVL